MSERGWWGVVEGFYGRPWAQAQRLELLARLEQGGLNAYLYAPKDDLWHRARWREPYPPEALAELGALIDAARARGVAFLYGLAPGLDLRHADAADRAALHAKLEQVLALGAAGAALLFDDIPGQLDPADQRRFGTLAAAQSDVAREVLERLRAAHPGAALFVCPTEYCGRMARRGRPGYLEALGRALPPEVELLWTGPEIVSPDLPPLHARDVAALLGRKPVLWDNLAADDYDLRRLHLGPFAGRPLALREEVRGVLLNPNCAHEANAPLLATFAAWRAARGAWDARAAWLDALRAWLPAWETADGAPIGLEELSAFGDCFYLPHTQGPSAEAWWDDLAHLATRPPSAWGAHEARFLAAAERLIGVCDRLPGLRRRELLHALYRPAWELKEELSLLVAWVRWRRAQPEEAPAFVHAHHRGGLLTRLRAVLALEPDGAGLRPALPVWARLRVRPALPDDEDALYAVCLQTGDSGQDATPLHTDPRALGHIYAGPYLRLEPELALVLEDEQGVAGYVLGALDSRAFQERYQREWLPPLRARHPAPTGDPAAWSASERCWHLLHHPELDLPAQVDAFPSHLHIDLLPRAQGKGQGRRLMQALFARLRARGSPGVHLGVGTRNVRAIAFYQHLGFRELGGREGCLYMGYDLTAAERGRGGSA